MNTPSAGAMRAAKTIMTADDPARFAADFAAEQEQKDMAEIIDRETGHAELVAVLEAVATIKERIVKAVPEYAYEMNLVMAALAKANAS